MKQVKVVCCQFEPTLGNVSNNQEKIEYLLERSKGLSPDVVVFPELCVQGVSPKEVIADTAQVIPGKTSDFFCALSKEYGVYGVLGLAERLGGRYYNVALLASPEGKIVGIYRKTHLWITEREIYSRGTEYPVFETDFGKVGMWICYDTRFPEVARILSTKGAIIAFVPTAWLARDVQHWELAVRSRALDNFIYVCGSDEIARSGFHQACGASLICSPNGEIMAKATHMKQMTIHATIDLELVTILREAIPVLEDL